MGIKANMLILAKKLRITDKEQLIFQNIEMQLKRIIDAVERNCNCKESRDKE